MFDLAPGADTSIATPLCAGTPYHRVLLQKSTGDNLAIILLVELGLVFDLVHRIRSHNSLCVRSI